MQKITLNVYKVKEAKKETITKIVASTKSANNFYEDLENRDIIPYKQSAKVETFYIDTIVATEKAQELANSVKGLSELETAGLVEAILKALDTACLVDLPKASK